jgi:hypothetical protein
MVLSRFDSRLLLIMFWCSNWVTGLEELVQLLSVYNETSLYPRVHYRLNAFEHQANKVMVCVWSAFAGANATSQHIVQTYPAQCFTDLAGVIPLETDVYGAYLVSAAVVQRGASLINEETRLSAVSDLIVHIQNMDIKMLSMPAQLMRENLLAINASEQDILSTSAAEAVRGVLLIPTLDPHKLRLSYKVQQCLEPCNPNHCSFQLNELQANARWSQVRHKSSISHIYMQKY